MSVITISTEIWQSNRERTVGLLREIAADPQATAILEWRPAPGRAHIAWQLMHIAVTEELFATERLVAETAAFPEWVGRFRGGSTPDDDIPTAEQILFVLSESRAHLLQTLGRFSDSDLDRVPEPLRERGWNLRKVLQVLAWHEPHHQGQAHITRNLWKAAHA
jgi:uncharacterized damage-inducible protein DinB